MADTQATPATSAPQPVNTTASQAAPMPAPAHYANSGHGPALAYHANSTTHANPAEHGSAPATQASSANHTSSAGYGPAPATHASSAGYGPAPATHASSAGYGPAPATQASSAGYGPANRPNGPAARPFTGQSGHRYAPRSRIQADSRKLFVGGIPRQTTQESFKAFFEEYGPTEEAFLVMDKQNPTMHRGFGFVTFVEQETTDKVVSEGTNGKLQLHGSSVDFRIAVPPQLKPPQPLAGTTKLFCGNCPKENFTGEQLTEYFKRFGAVKESWASPKGFGFVTFEDINGCNRALIHGINSKHMIDEHQIEVKWPRVKNRPHNMQRPNFYGGVQNRNPYYNKTQFQGHPYMAQQAPQHVGGYGQQAAYATAGQPQQQYQVAYVQHNGQQQPHGQQQQQCSSVGMPQHQPVYQRAPASYAQAPGGGQAGVNSRYTPY